MGNRLDHGELAALDAPRDLDFALAREQRHRPHLAEYIRTGSFVLSRAPGVRSSSISSAPSPVRSIVFSSLSILVRVDDLDAGAAERVEQIIELVRRGDLGRQQLVDFVVQQVAFFLADVNQLPYFVVFFPSIDIHEPRGAPNPRSWTRSRHRDRVSRTMALRQPLNPLEQDLFLLPQAVYFVTVLIGAAVLQAVDLALQDRLFPFPTDQFKRTDAFANNQGGGAFSAATRVTS